MWGVRLPTEGDGVLRSHTGQKQSRCDNSNNSNVIPLHQNVALRLTYTPLSKVVNVRNVLHHCTVQKNDVTPTR